MQQVNLLTRSAGLNVVVDPVRLRYDPEAGQQELAVALNVDIDQTGRVSKRRGYEQVSSTPCHSVWHGAGRTLAVSNGWIVLVGEDFSYLPLHNLAHDERVWFLDVNGDVFWGNGFETGILRGGMVPQAWPFLMPQSENDDRHLEAMPVGKNLELYNGRIFLAKDNAVFYSEPLGYYATDMARNWFVFESPVSMVRAVEGGLYVGTGTEVNFLGGPTVQEMTRTVVSTSPPIEGTCAKIDGRHVMQGEILQRGVMWTAQDGIYVGFPGGQVFNLTKDKLRYPGGNSGSAVAHGDTYLSLIDP